MGLLSKGQPLDWNEAKKYSEYIKLQGIKQFINLYNGSKERADGPFTWGDEVEYILVKYNHRNRVAQMNLVAERVFKDLADEQAKLSSKRVNSCWHPEYAACMIESTPKLPYGLDDDLLQGLCDMEISMARRRREVFRVLRQDESVLTITSFPRSGAPNCTYPTYKPKPDTSACRSLYMPDEAIFQGHPRFLTITKNVRARRGSKVFINVPIYRDAKTPNPFLELLPANNEEVRKSVKPNHIHLDAMIFGMGCCCLQLTMQASHLKEAKNLYDQLLPLAPVLIALSAGSPIYRGYLTERDCRWDVISAVCDDRTPIERGEVKSMDNGHSKYISKSRYASVSSYLSCQGQKYNDIDLAINDDYYQLMVANKVEPAVARHIAHLFIRDSLVMYREKLDQSVDDTDHFENIQSSNWQTLRFKPPPCVGSPIGWRVEFRPIEVQTTDFENSAYCVFIILLSRVILAYNLNFLLPISLVDDNMMEAQKRDAVRSTKFWFRHVIYAKQSNNQPMANCNGSKAHSSPVLEDLSNNNACNQNRATTSETNNTTYNHLNGRLANSHSNLNGQITNILSSSLINSALTGNNNSNTNGNTNGNSNNNHNRSRENSHDELHKYARQMSVNEIINGSNQFVGLIPILLHYVNSLHDGSNTNTIELIKRYLNLISERASLKTKTTARFMRDFVINHPKYEHDSVVSDHVNYDLLVLMDKIGKGEVQCPELLGRNR